ncbi:hypothetical protein [Pseudomonas sp. LP_7_YM]|uniref:hypothetical protein n=1 Tax=Pseudomonas sp. LP_7_YM TaxID=2485137 RepID=UPI00105F8712|nr:hypothetical protein [Pseudomonas sp. LP_7_YM]TDV67828.1 hypothetical protein EC915_103365 [Pseudomonas sp. LP_7_YM]
MHAAPYEHDPRSLTPYLLSDEDQHYGGDQSPLNDADGDEDSDPEAELDLGELQLDEFADSDKLDIGSSTLG